ncbi:MAG: class I SAM-dependent methyltransferase [Gammaproteobacteria bacterium]|nr:MAG: class I SAM-dependent methyltransferase [Gammaproteobacteria bacterium]
MKNYKCMNCRSTNIERFIDLGRQPNGNHFPSSGEVESEPKFPFAMAVCQDCWQVQIEEFPSAEFMFTNHPYITGVNMPVVTHFDTMVTRTIEKFNISENSLILDIGANDGTLLSNFRRKGMRVLGIDPGQRTGRLAKENGITVCETFWDKNTANSLKQLGIQPDLITATAVFYHVEDIHSFVEGLSNLMDENTVFLTQCVYLKDVIEKVQFDHFYHEHTMIHAIAPLKRLFGEYGLKILDVDFYSVHGGSFVLYVGKDGSPYKSSPNVQKAIHAEKEAGLQDMSTYMKFTKCVEKNRDDLNALLDKITAEGKSIYALGAPLKGSTLLNYCGIGTDSIKLATEVNRFKIGKLTPGTHIPIVYEESIGEQPDYYLVLSWNFLDYFIDKYKDYLRAGGQFIIPHPEVRVIGHKTEL